MTGDNGAAAEGGGGRRSGDVLSCLCESVMGKWGGGGGVGVDERL